MDSLLGCSLDFAKHRKKKEEKKEKKRACKVKTEKKKRAKGEHGKTDEEGKHDKTVKGSRKVWKRGKLTKAAK